LQSLLLCLRRTKMSFRAVPDEYGENYLPKTSKARRAFSVPVICAFKNRHYSLIPNLNVLIRYIFGMRSVYNAI